MAAFIIIGLWMDQTGPAPAPAPEPAAAAKGSTPGLNLTESAQTGTGKKNQKSKTASGSTAGKRPRSKIKPRPGLRDDGPRVKTAAEMRAPGNSLLQSPDSREPDDGRYGKLSREPADDLPWRQSSFFGIRGSGQFFVYVVDCSESMIDEDRFARATIELRRSVLALQPPQRFEVIFYNKTSIPMPGGPQPRPADQTQKSHLMAWLRLIEPLGTTDPRPALTQALHLRPDAIFLLSDGVFPDGSVETAIKLNTHQIPIHCVDLSGGQGGNQLERIARSSGGRYASRPVNTLRAKP